MKLSRRRTFGTGRDNRLDQRGQVVFAGGDRYIRQLADEKDGAATDTGDVGRLQERKVVTVGSRQIQLQEAFLIGCEGVAGVEGMHVEGFFANG